jgi:Spy/CpxP family protein refolding chaperone
MKTPLLLLFLTTSLLHAQAPRDPIGDNLFPPEFILTNADAIHLTDEQRQAVRELMEKVQSQFREMESGLQREGEALGQVLAQPAPGQANVLAQFDKVQDRERVMKRAQITLMLDLREKLTPEQRAKLTELRAKNTDPQPANPPPTPASLQEKAGRVQNGAARWQEDGRDLSPIVTRMDRLDPLLRAGKFREADAMLDEVLKLLGKDAK